jgi:hypothetical protein
MCIYGWVGGWMGGWMGGWVDGWVDKMRWDKPHVIIGACVLGV